MSFWSAAAKGFTGALKKVPVVGDMLAGSADNLFQEYEKQSDWNKETNWQKYMTTYQNDFNANQNQLQRDFNSAEAEKSRQFNSAEAEKSRIWELDLWNKQNDYNSPSNQLKLMQEAGLNPMLFNASDASAGSVGSVGSATSSPASSSVIGSGAVPSPPMLQNPSLIASQIRKNDSESEKNEADIDLKQSERDRLNKLLSGELENQRWQAKLNQDELENLRPAQVRQLLASSNNLDKACEKMQAEIINANKQFELLDDDHKKRLIENNYLEKQIKASLMDTYVSTQLKRSQISLNSKQGQALEKQAQLFAKEAANAIITGKMLALNFDILGQTKDSTIAKMNSSDAVQVYFNNKDMDYKDLIYWLDRAGCLIGGSSSSLSKIITLMAK